MRAIRTVFAGIGLGFTLLGLARCGAESSTAAGEGPGRVPDEPPSTEASALAEAQCDYLERCDADAMYLFAENARSACEEYFACRAKTPRWPALGEPSVLQGCIESLRTRDCPDLEERPLARFSYATDLSFPWGPECGEPDLKGLVAPPPDAPRSGEPCIDGHDERAVCEVGTYCRAADDQLVAGHYYCGTCTPIPGLGEACDDQTPCVEGSWCISGACERRRDLGEPCEEADQCRLGVCEASVCGRSRYAPTPYVEVVGHDCDPEAWDNVCGNQAALYCKDGTCSAFPEEGEPCGGSVALGICRLGHSCIKGRCVALGCSIDPGEACDGFCDGGDCVHGVCVPAGEIGDPCQVSCGNGLWCIENRCDLPSGQENGTPCDFDWDCASTFCERDLNDYCEDGFCSIPSCGGCGLCADPATIERCE